MKAMEGDIVIVGGGPAGIAAACCAAESGQHVVLIDANPSPGGQIWRSVNSPVLQKPPAAKKWLDRFHKSGTKYLAGREVIGIEQPGVLRVAAIDGPSELISYRKLLISTGARELMLPLPGWTLPGFFGAGGLQALVKSGLPVANKRIVVAGSGPLLLAVASTLSRGGATVVLVAEQAPWSCIISFAAYLLRSHFLKFREAVHFRRALKGIAYRTGCWLRSVHGQTCVEGVTMTNGTRQWKEKCDYVACGFGLVPNLEVPLLIGCEVNEQRVVANSFQQTSVPDVYCAGEAVGIGGLETALLEGRIAGLAMSGDRTAAEQLFAARDKQRKFATRLQSAFQLRSELTRLAEPSTIVCRCEDVMLERLLLYRGWREAKLQSRCGMGACQGRICGPACEFLFGWKTDSVRPPIFPCRVDQLLDTED